MEHIALQWHDREAAVGGLLALPMIFKNGSHVPRAR